MELQLKWFIWEEDRVGTELNLQLIFANKTCGDGTLKKGEKANFLFYTKKCLAA